MSDSQPEGKNRLEWCVFACGCILTGGAIGCLVYEALTEGESTPPAIAVHTGKPEPRNGQFTVPVTVENSGDTTAEGVHVEVVVSHGDAAETAELEFDYLPAHGTRSGAVTFSRDPRGGKTTGRPVGYQIP